MKLFKVTCKNTMVSSVSVTYGISYVVAEDPTDAYNKVREKLDEWGIGFEKDRELKSIELIAEDSRYTDCDYILYI